MLTLGLLDGAVRSSYTEEDAYIMASEVSSFGDNAKSLARNPLGIIALFIVLVYGFASLVTAAGGNLTPAERLPLIYFMVLFPVLVLGVFSWMVCKHWLKFFGPGDFPNPGDYMDTQMLIVASLVAAGTKQDTPRSQSDLADIVRTVRSATANRVNADERWVTRILWVDDHPDNNILERQAFEAMGLSFTLALCTEDALKKLRQSKYAAIISDMGRREGPREGYVLLDTLRKQGNNIPLIFYASSNAPEHKRETLEHGGQGCTNNANELFHLVTKATRKSTHLLSGGN